VLSLEVIDTVAVRLNAQSKTQSAGKKQPLFNQGSCDVLCLFTVLQGTLTHSSDENSVCLSVRPSVCQTHDL